MATVADILEAGLQAAAERLQESQHWLPVETAEETFIKRLVCDIINQTHTMVEHSVKIDPWMIS